MHIDYLHRLEAILPAPQEPWCATGDWEAVELQFGTPLPEDYKQFISKYGTGLISYGLRVYNYLENPGRAEKMLGHLRVLQERTQAELVNVAELLGRDSTEVQLSLPFPIYPEPGGLFPWGEADDWWTFYWLRTGSPAEWGTVATYKGIESYDYYPNMSAVTFLVNLFQEHFHQHLRLEPDFQVIHPPGEWGSQ
jgi:hypothetical protein